MKKLLAILAFLLLSSIIAASPSDTSQVRAKTKMDHLVELLVSSSEMGDFSGISKSLDPKVSVIMQVDGKIKKFEMPPDEIVRLLNYVVYGLHGNAEIYMNGYDYMMTIKAVELAEPVSIIFRTGPSGTVLKIFVL